MAKKESTAYCSVTYLWSFTRAELGLSADATDAELEAAAEERMEQITGYIFEHTDFFHNDCEISVA